MTIGQRRVTIILIPARVGPDLITTDIKNMDKINKLPLPATILIACIILGGFYYFSQTSRQNYERAQQEKILSTKRVCAFTAEMSAIDFYKKNCTYDCKEGQYYVANYDNAYKICLQQAGLE